MGAWTICEGGEGVSEAAMSVRVVSEEARDVKPTGANMLVIDWKSQPAWKTQATFRAALDKVWT